MLIQQEVGILGFLITSNKILLQAKTEPGNVNGTQIAPTLQATASNLDCVHGGEKPHYADIFLDNQIPCLAKSIQSEQGSRFFRKFNQNMLIRIDRTFPTSNQYRWVHMDALFDLMDENFLINTDARSVLISCSWASLTGREPFSRHKDPFAKELNQSYHDDSSIAPIKEAIVSLRNNAHIPEIKKLTDLGDWEVGAFTIRPLKKGPYEIIQISVSAENREVTSWDQPILHSFGEGFAALVCGRRNGLVHFLFRCQIEAGLSNYVELGPSLVIEPGETQGLQQINDYKDYKILNAFKQSDEGGRFFKDISLYQLIDIGEITDVTTGDIWLTLGQIQKLIRQGGWFTNEARSVLSLLLKWI